MGLGPTLVVVKQTPNGSTYGALWNHIWSVAGGSNRADVNSTVTASANLEASYDWEGRHCVVPLNLSGS